MEEYKTSSERICYLNTQTENEKGINQKNNAKRYPQNKKQSQAKEQKKPCCAKEIDPAREK